MFARRTGFAVVAGFALAAIVLFAWPQRASAQGGYGGGFGPVIAYGDGTWSLGWEAGATGAATLIKFSVGGTYALSASADAPSSLFYVAYEPWLLVGVTLGYAVADKAPSFLHGVWEAYPVALQGKLYGGDNSDDVHPLSWLFTVAIGVRFFGGRTQFYMTPKLWRFATIELNS